MNRCSYIEFNFFVINNVIFYSISYLKDIHNLHDVEKAKEIYYEILNEEKKNQIPQEVLERASKEFDIRFQNIDWQKYYKDLPFNKSAVALYEWSPIADELKTLDKKIVLNSMILKWDNVKKEFKDLINF